MRILIHTDVYYPLCNAGAYRMKVFAETFVRQGHQVSVLTSSTNLQGKTKERLDEKVIYAPTIRMRKKTPWRRFLNNISFSLSSLFCCFKAGKADVVITTSPPLLANISGWIIAKMKRAKLVYDVRDIWPDVAIQMDNFNDKSLYYKVFHRMANFMYKHSNLITTVSPSKVRNIHTHLQQLSFQKKNKPPVILVENGFDERILNSDIQLKIVEKYHLDKVPTCVYIGNIGLAQGLEQLLAIAEQSKHKEMQYLLFGVGADKERLEVEAKKRQLHNVHFLGVLEHESVFTVLQYAKLSFISLKNDKMIDSIPTKLYESLGLGCPVFLVASGDACDILRESRLGVCTSPNRIETMVNEFDTMIDHYENIINNKEYAKNLIKKKYSRQCISLKFEKFLCNFMDKTK